MASTDGRDATQPYRVRVGGVWYWVDPAVPTAELEPGDIVVVYPRQGDGVLAALRSPPGSTMSFSSLGGEAFEVADTDIEALHLAAMDEEQG